MSQKFSHLQLLKTGLGLCALAYSASCQAGSLSTLYSFQGGGTNGSQPLGGLTFDGNTIYGVTAAGGAYASGTVFAYDRIGENVVQVFSFPAGTGAGDQINLPLAYVNGLFYATFFSGGDYDCGTAVQIDPTHGSENVLLSFQCGEFQAPNSNLLYANSLLYGTTLGSGDEGDPGYGTIFSIDPVTGTENVVNRLDGNIGYGPVGGMIEDEGSFFGTTIGGGAGDVGTIFSFNPATGAVRPVHQFNYRHGPASPKAGVVYHNGLLYGITEYRSKKPDASGTVFMFDALTRKARILHSFNSKHDGFVPAWLTYIGSTLYGTAAVGGKEGCGLLYKMNPNTGYEEVLVDFPCADRVNPLFSAYRGVLYGVTAAGGLGYGTVFKYMP